MSQLALYGSIGWKHPQGIFQVLEWAREFGWDSVDARGMTLDIPGGSRKQITPFGYDMLGPRQIAPGARRQLKEWSDDYGLPIICLYVANPVNLRGTLGEEQRQLFQEFIDLAVDLGIPWVRAINNTTESYDEAPFTVEEAFERTVAGLLDVGKYAAEREIGILIENNENTTTSCADELLSLQNALKGDCRIGIAFDPANAYFQGLNEHDELEELAGSIDFLHLKNAKRHADPTYAYMPRGDYSYEWSPLAEGDLQWEAILKHAFENGFDGPLTFEYVNPFKGMPADYWNILREPALAAEQEAEYLRSLLTSLKTSPVQH